MKKKAQFWKNIDNETVQCLLCAHSCKIKNNNTGICGVRKNESGELYTLIYGSCSSISPDPIEKKPLYHFYPGTNVLSFGTIGCNFKCSYCQNYEISTANPESNYLQEYPPEEAIKMAKRYNCKGIAWTYNEPTIWYEYTLDSAILAKKSGLYTVYVTNGYINEEPLKEIAPYLDAMNIDIKAFNDGFYKELCNGKLEPVLNTCKLAKDLGIHLEVTYLVIPTYNDSTNEVKKFCNWVVENLGKNTPIHFSRFHPDYKMTNIPATPLKTLLKIYDIAKDCGILYPYVGNVPHGNYENTVCPHCGNVCIERYGFSTSLTGINKGECTRCGKEIPLIV